MSAIANLIKKISGEAEGKGKAQVSPYASRYSQSLGFLGFTKNGVADNADAENFYAGARKVFATLQVKYKNEIFFGSGKVATGIDTRGILYVDLKDNSATPVQVEGEVQLILKNITTLKESVYKKPRTENLRGSQTDINNGFRLAMGGNSAGFQNELELAIVPDADFVFSVANSVVLVPMTTFALK